MFTSISRQCRDKDLVDEDHVGPCTARSGAFAESRLHSSIVKEQLRMSKPGEPLTAFTAQGHMALRASRVVYPQTRFRSNAPASR
jgi:hypothetical protein